MSRALILAALVAAPLPCLAQTRTLEPGDQVRVHAPAVISGPFRAQVVSYFSDTLKVRSEAADTVYALPISSIRRLARSEGMDRGRSVRHGLRVGAFLGASTGVVMGPMLARMSEENRFVQTTAISAGVGLVGGTVLGGVLGAIFPREHWQRYGMTHPPVTAPPPPPPVLVSAPVAQ